jgi:hypothetical protein
MSPSFSKGLPRPRVQGGVMTGWYPGWQVTIAWLLAVAVAGLIYFVPVTQLVYNLSDHPATVTAAE